MRVSGAVRLGNLIAYDTNSGTRWLQETGEALEGPHKGKKLNELNPDQYQARVRFDVWKKDHPNTKVLVCHHCDAEAAKTP